MKTKLGVTQERWGEMVKDAREDMRKGHMEKMLKFMTKEQRDELEKLGVFKEERMADRVLNCLSERTTNFWDLHNIFAHSPEIADSCISVREERIVDKHYLSFKLQHCVLDGKSEYTRETIGDGFKWLCNPEFAKQCYDKVQGMKENQDLTAKQKLGQIDDMVRDIFYPEERFLEQETRPTPEKAKTCGCFGR
jgi:hypothetical protein